MLCTLVFMYAPQPSPQTPDVEALLTAPLGSQAAAALERKPSQSEDLFSAHNFDITINLDIPAPGTGNMLRQFN